MRTYGFLWGWMASPHLCIVYISGTITPDGDFVLLAVLKILYGAFHYLVPSKRTETLKNRQLVPLKLPLEKPQFLSQVGSESLR